MNRSGGVRVLAIAVAALALVILAAIAIGWPPAPRAPTGASPASSAAPWTPSGSGRVSPGPTASPTSPIQSGSGSPVAGTPGPTVPESIVFVGAGDIADCGSEGDSQTAAILDALPGATFFTLGDNAYEEGTRQEFESCYGPTWGRHIDRTRPSPGNHEYLTTGAAGYFDYFGDRAGPDRRGYYAYDLGAWRIYSLNSNCEHIDGCGDASPQLAWLRADLAEHPSRCSLAYWHHPRFSSAEHGSQGFMASIWDTLFAAGTDVVLAGHDHTYERFVPMLASGQAARDFGITSFVVGTGGRRLYEFETILPTSAARARAWGVLELTLSPDGWSSRFIPVAGGSFTDTASAACH